ncbi:MAG: sulfate adenylyltransferase subunit 2 [Sphingomonadales bacterium]|jgi:sulfate adenylyltransferase subunit 2|nr:sulfate adenylyltransferase subunit 2 [Sphingomonadales bacterium]MEA3042275.1 sulfate adenylyltransferase subunit 2 [Sphingomonadales bacterium]
MRLTLDHLDRLEAEAIQIIREGVAEAERPAMLFSGGKDSCVMLHLARKAFFPARPPFPLLHVDTGWKFAELYALRDALAADAGLELIVHRNPEAEARGINPFDHGATIHTQMWKTEGLRQALDAGRFDLAFGGARRDEEMSRAKERVFSVRTAGHGWDPKRQRPELWRLYNGRLGPGESLRVFPLSDWTERDVWDYVAAQEIRVASLYFAAERPTAVRDGVLIIADDGRLQATETRRVRVRTVGCWPLTGAVESEAETIAQILAEMAREGTSERAGRLIDRDQNASMERKKREGYF